MSVEICYIPSGGDEEINHRLLEDNEALYIHDYSSGTKEIFTVECMSDGLPRVRTLPGEGPLDNGFEGCLDNNELPPAIATVHVDEHRPHDHDIVTEENGSGIVRVRYADSSKVTVSKLIPRLLRNQN